MLNQELRSLSCNFPLGNSKCRLQIGNRFRGFSLVDPCHRGNLTICTRGYFTPENHSPDPEVSEIRPGFELKCFSFFFSLGSCVSLHLFLALRQEHSNSVWKSGYLPDMQQCEVDRQTSGPTLQQANSAPLVRSRWCQ